MQATKQTMPGPSVTTPRKRKRGPGESLGSPPKDELHERRLPLDYEQGKGRGREGKGNGADGEGERGKGKVKGAA